jgi:Asp-tRNA(Asn)/Glu-tRNA(Gln) amidotransferase A subunit family amidase
MKTKTSSVSRPVTELEYGPTSISDGVHGELHAAAAYGDLADGPHGTFIKMPAGYVSPTHIHTEDYWAVVVKTYPSDAVARALVQRATVTRQWQLFLNRCAVLLIPVSAELPFPDGLDLQGDAAFQRVWDAQFLLRATPPLGLPILAVSTGLVGQSPVGVQIVAGRYREDLCLLAGEAIEARGTPPAPIDPRS